MVLEGETYVAERDVWCVKCGFSEQQELDVILKNMVEFGEWACSKCGKQHDYEHVAVWL